MPRGDSSASGSLRLRALAAALPAQVREGFRAGLELAPPAAERATTIFAVGMGGSAIPVDLARGIVEAETQIALVPVRSPDLPRAVERRSRVLFISYSGETAETLRAYDHASRSGASRIVVASGGTLADRAERDGVPLLALPPGIPPRCAAGQVLGGILGLLDPWFPESNEGRMQRATGRLEATIPRMPAAAASIGRRIGTGFPSIYAESRFGGVARRWKTQIEENAKQLAAFDEVPELLHNAIVGWDAMPRAAARRCSVVLLQWEGALPLTRRNFAYLERLLGHRGARVIPVTLAGEDPIDAVLHGLALGDYVSLSLADQRRVDPYPIDAITRLKAALASRPSS
ncbi:MAG: SIS domain-containing protein [Thermoplasmata archaeon]